MIGVCLGTNPGNGCFVVTAEFWPIQWVRSLNVDHWVAEY